MSSSILVINCGSSSIKFSVVDPGKQIHHLSGIAERLGGQDGELSWKGVASGTRALGTATHEGALRAVVELLDDVGLSIRAVGHRTVHGGERFKSSCVVTDEVKATIRELQHLAPLHNPVNLLGIEAAQAAFPDLPHVAVFDTSFHQTMPERAFLYPIPYDYYEKYGIRRYGFHGTSHRYVSAKAAEMLGKPIDDLALVTAHLGNGCSAAAIRGGQCMDTTMGLTPLEGLVMGTRCGDIDPSLHTHLCNTLNVSLDEVMDILNKGSGLLGLSGSSNDMRTLIQKETEGDKRAALAIEVFCYRLAKSLASLCVAAGGLDTLIFTGGIGEHSAQIRARVIEQLVFLGLKLNSEANASHGKNNNGQITTGDNPMAMVVATDEEYIIALDTASLI